MQDNQQAPPPDSSWAPVARDTRDALAKLGRHIKPRCLPDEPDACGASFSQHALAHMAAIVATCMHQLAHLGHDCRPLFEEILAAEVESATHACPERLV